MYFLKLKLLLGLKLDNSLGNILKSPARISTSGKNLISISLDFLCLLKCKLQTAKFSKEYFTAILGHLSKPFIIGRSILCFENFLFVNIPIPSKICSFCNIPFP